jgi:hypothetical protein
MVGFCEHDDEPSGYIKIGHLLHKGIPTAHSDDTLPWILTSQLYHGKTNFQIYKNSF